MKRILFTILLIVSSCNSSQSVSFPAPFFNKNFSASERVMAEKAFKLFSQICQPLMGEYAEDIVAISLSHGFDRRDDSFNNGCSDYRCEKYDWDKQIYMTIKLKREPKHIPIKLRAFGHTEHYYFGGPRNPGITITKFPELCGIEDSNNGSDVYVYEPRLSFIKN